MGSSIRLGRIAGIQIGLHASWFVIFFIVAYLFVAGTLRQSYPHWQEPVYWLVGTTISLLFFASVLAHELSHALVARRFGLRVRDITLFIFGGAASLEDEAKRPRDEAVMAGAGPVASLVLGAVLWGIGVVVPQPQVSAIAGWLGFINVWLGL